MKKVLFCALNARYNHTNLAIRSLCTYGAKKLKERGLDGKLELRVKEQSINQSAEEIIRSIAEAFDGTEPDLLLFSVYIWNCSLTYTVAEAIKQIFPEMIIGFGGPEVSYQSSAVFKKCGAPSFIIKGEGERPVADILIKLAETESGGFIDAIASVKGLFFRGGSFSGDFLPVPLEDIPFVYANAPFEERADIKDCIVYYESSRGCPFNCAYCLSSIDKKVRTLPLERVLAEISYFMAQGFRLIKFVDRTFNLNPSHYLKIWQYIIENHNGKTAFHFEIEARNLCEESFELLAIAPAGAIQ
ncbi:MAG: cobalamin-dependent protein, partial [Spirochaetaceae bacterium]|nr:cobalamin-dependent protein [Spirochaetaceae bacterium]